MAMVDHALALAQRGWRVFPCDARSKRPLLKIREQRRPIDGFIGPMPGDGGWKGQASTDAKTIRGWWSQWPGALIGVPQGLNTGSFVVDLDVGGEHTRASLRAALEQFLGVPLPASWQALTGGGGEHIWFALPTLGGQEGRSPRPIILTNGRGALPGKAVLPIDVRGEGGYVVVPPSVRADGKRYEWIVGPDQVALARPPAELVDCLLYRGRFAEAKARPPAPIAAARARAGDTAAHNYAERALEAELRHIAQLAEGERNESLFHAAIRMAQLVAAGVLDDAETLAALHQAIGGWPNRRKNEGTIRQGWKRGLAEPRDLSDVGARAPSSSAAPVPPPADESAYGQPAQGKAPASQGGLRSGAPSPRRGKRPLASARGVEEHRKAEEQRQLRLDRELAFYPLTDLGNAERFAARWKMRLLFCPKLGWFFWDDRRWSREGAEERVKQAEHDTVRAIRREAEWLASTGLHDQQDNPDGKDIQVGEDGDGEPVLLSDRLAQFARASEENRRLTPIAKRAEAMLDVAERLLDADDFKINCRNGTLVVDRGSKTIAFKEHDPADLITLVMGVDYDPDATCATYDGFLAQVQPDPMMRDYLHDWAGYNTIGDVTAHQFHYWHGRGRNGKTTLLECWAALAGDYGKAPPVETFMQKKQQGNAGPKPELAMLRAKRYVHTSEPEKGSRLAEGLMKMIAGGDEMPVRDLYGKYFDLRPKFKMTIAGNYKPDMAGGEKTSGIWQRFKFVPWKVTIRKEDIDPALPAKLKAELSGVLNHLLDGLDRWMDRGLVEPLIVAEATEQFRQDSDPLGRFLDECCLVETAAREKAEPLYLVFKAWCAARSENEWTGTGFGRALSERFEKRKSNGWFYLGLRLIKSVKDFLDHEGNPLRDSSPEGESDPPAEPSHGLEEDDDIPF